MRWVGEFFDAFVWLGRRVVRFGGICLRGRGWCRAFFFGCSMRYPVVGKITRNVHMRCDCSDLTYQEGILCQSLTIRII